MYDDLSTKYFFKIYKLGCIKTIFKLFIIRQPHEYLEIIYFHIHPSLTIFTYEETFDFDCSTFLKNVTWLCKIEDMKKIKTG